MQKVKVRYKGEEGEQTVEMWPIDATHAVAVDPDHYSLVKPEDPKPEAVAEAEKPEAPAAEQGLDWIGNDE